MEVALAVGIAAFALLAIVGLLPVGLSSSRNAVQGTEAVNIASAIINDLRIAAQGASMGSVAGVTSPLYGLPLEGGNSPIKYFDEMGNQMSASTAKYRASVVVTPLGGAAAIPDFAQNYQVSVIVTWPASALEKNAAGRMEMNSTFTPDRGS